MDGMDEASSVGPSEKSVAKFVKTFLPCRPI